MLPRFSNSTLTRFNKRHHRFHSLVQWASYQCYHRKAIHLLKHRLWDHHPSCPRSARDRLCKWHHLDHRHLLFHRKRQERCNLIRCRILMKKIKQFNSCKKRFRYSNVFDLYSWFGRSCSSNHQSWNIY